MDDLTVVARPTVFVGGYYYPSLYRASLFYGPWGPGYYGFYGYGPAHYQYPIYGGRGRYDNSGSVRLQISPRQAEVFVDGYFAGTVDDFDGVFQRLNIQPGEHEIQVYLAGYRSFTQRFYLQPGKSFNIKHAMEPLRPGENAPPRPDPAPLAGPGLAMAMTAGRESPAVSAVADAVKVLVEARVAVPVVKGGAAVRVDSLTASDRFPCACSRLMPKC